MSILSLHPMEIGTYTCDEVGKSALAEDLDVIPGLRDEIRNQLLNIIGEPHLPEEEITFPTGFSKSTFSLTNNTVTIVTSLFVPENRK